MDGYRVLVLGKAPPGGPSAEEVLGAKHHCVRRTRSPGAALQVLADDDTDVIVADLDVLGAGAQDFLDELHTRQLDPEVVLIRGPAHRDAAARGLRRGAFGLLRTPVDDDELLHTVQQAARYRTLRHERRSLQQALVGAAGSHRLKDVEREHILAVYEAAGRQKKRAAEQLGISLRTLYNKLAAYSRGP